MTWTMKQMIDARKRESSASHYLRTIDLLGDSAHEDDGVMVVEGLAVVFDVPTVLFEWDGHEVKEIIDRHAFDETDISGCFFKYNHSNNMFAMARTKNDSLKLEIKEPGVYVRAELVEIPESRSLFTLIKRGIIDKMSFAFDIADEEFDEETYTFRIKKVSKLWDVAAVNNPAYDGTSIFARRREDVEAIRAKQVESFEQQKREKLQSHITQLINKFNEKN